MELPGNFDKYSHIIDYYRNLGFNCFNSHEEILRFIYDNKEGYKFKQKSNEELEYNYGVYCRLIKRVKLDIITDLQRVDLLQNSNQQIETYLKKFLNLNLYNEDYLIIKHNSNTIELPKCLFGYCGYSKLFDTIPNEITIDPEFDQITSGYFVEFLTKQKINSELLNDKFHFDQLTRLIDFLDVKLIK